MKQTNILNTVFMKLNTNKKLKYAVFCALAVFVVVVYVLSLKGESSRKNAQSKELDTSQIENIEERLASTLAQIRGAGKVSVMITYETTEELVPAMSSQKQTSESKSNGGSTNNETESNQIATVNTDGKQQPIVITQIQPKVRGAIIVAEGAADITVRMNLAYAASAVLGIDESLIEVFEMSAD